MSTKEANLKSENRSSKSPAQKARQDSPKQSPAHNPTLSLCMIVKDEEKSLSTCLESVKDHVDEIIIVDTGSTDSTVEIAKKYNAKIYHHPWENSFSKARNYSLKYATCDWILIMDADEEMESNDAHKLREVIKDDDVNLIYLPAFSKHKGGKNSSVYLIERLYKNHLGFRYEGTVHNALKFSGPHKNENIVVYHYGYHQGEEQMEKRFARTSTLLKEQIMNDPENPVPHHNLAISYLDRQMNDKCLEEALEAIRLFELQNSDSQMRLLCHYVACVAFFRKQDLYNAEKYALKAIKFYPDYLDAHCILTSIYFLQKEYDKCNKATKSYLRSLKSIQSDPSKVMSIPFDTLNHAWLAHTRMAINHYEQGNQDYGRQALNNAINCADNAWEPYFAVGKHFAEHNNLKMAERLLCDGLKHNPGNKEIQYYLASTYERSGETEKAIACLEQILVYQPEEAQARYNLGLLLLKCNKPDEAIKTFKSVINKEPEHFDARLNMAIAYEKTGNIDESKDIYNALATINPENPDVLLRLGSIYLQENDNNMATEYFLKLLKIEKYLKEAHLGLSKAYLYINDPESCMRSCDELLKHLNLPRNITINSLNDLSKLYMLIGTTLIKHQNEALAGFAFEIAVLLDPDALKSIQAEAAEPVTCNP